MLLSHAAKARLSPNDILQFEVDKDLQSLVSCLVGVDSDTLRLVCGIAKVIKETDADAEFLTPSWAGSSIVFPEDLDELNGRESRSLSYADALAALLSGGPEAL